MNFKLKCICLGFLFLIPLIGEAQETRIHLLDERDKEGIAFANIILLSIIDNTITAGYVSDEKGFVSFDLKERSLIKISYIGYQDYFATIRLGKKRTL